MVITEYIEQFHNYRKHLACVSAVFVKQGPYNLWYDMKAFWIKRNPSKNHRWCLNCSQKSSWIITKYRRYNQNLRVSFSKKFFVGAVKWKMMMNFLLWDSSEAGWTSGYYFFRKISWKWREKFEYAHKENYKEMNIYLTIAKFIRHSGKNIDTFVIMRTK